MRQIPQHIKTIIRLLPSDASPKPISLMLPGIINNIERIGQTCVTLARSAENSFVSVMDLLGEVLEATEVTRGLHEKELHDKDIELNITRILHADMKREEEVRQAVRKAQVEYSRALNDIPTGFKALGLELGRAVISLLKTFTLSYMSDKMGGSIPIKYQTSGNNRVKSFANDQTLNFASCFAQSLLREALRLFGLLRKHCHKLVDFFIKFSAQVTTDFDETLKTFLDITQFLNGNSINLYRESYILFIIARTYFNVSKTYLMPRLSGLSLMLTAENDNERQRLLSELERNTLEIQANVTELINERKRIYQKIISEKRAEFNEQIDSQGPDGNELDTIKKGKILLRF